MRWTLTNPIGDRLHCLPARQGNTLRHERFFYVADKVVACVYGIDQPKSDYHVCTIHTQSRFIAGFCKDMTINELACCVGKTVGFRGESIFSTRKRDELHHKRLDSDKLLGMCMDRIAAVRLAQGKCTSVLRSFSASPIYTGLSNGNACTAQLSSCRTATEQLY